MKLILNQGFKLNQNDTNFIGIFYIKKVLWYIKKLKGY